MVPSPPSSSVLEAIQALVNSDVPAHSRQVVEMWCEVLLSDNADSVLLQELEIRRRQRAERSICVFEQWRALLKRCRREGIEAAFAWQAQLTALDTAMAALNLSSSPPAVFLGEDNTFKHATASGTYASLAELLRSALPLLDPETQPISQAILHAELAHAWSQMPVDNWKNHFDEAIACAKAAIPVLQDAGLLDRLARAQYGLGIASLEKHTSSGEMADLLTGLDACRQVGQLMFARYNERLEDSSLNLALNALQRALEAAPRDTLDWPRRRYEVGLAHHLRFSVRSSYVDPLATSRSTTLVDPADLDAAIAAMRDAVDASADSSPDRLQYQSDLALSLWERFEQFGELSDLDATIEAHRVVLALTPRSQRYWGDNRGKLGMALHSRFLYFWKIADLDEALAAIQDALGTSLPGSEEWAMWENNLGVGLRTRFRALGEVTDLDDAIEATEKALKATREDVLNWSMRRYNLGLALLERFDFTHVIVDLDNSIAAFQSCLQRTPVYSHKWAIYSADLGVALRKRFETLYQLADLERAIEHLRDAIEGVPKAFSARARWQANLGVARLAHYRSSNEPAELDAAIDALSEAVMAMPERSSDWGRAQTDLGIALAERFLISKAPSDLDAAITAYQDALASYEAEEWPDHVFSAANALARLHFFSRSWDAAARTFHLAIHALDLLYQRQILITGREGWLKRASDIYRLAAYALARSGDLQRAAVTLERGRARSLGEALARDRVDLQRLRLADPKACEIYEQAVTALRQQVAMERAEGLTWTQDSPRVTPEALRTQARQVHSALAAALAYIRHIPGYEDFLTTPDFDDIAGVIQPDLPLVYLVTTPVGSLGLILYRTHDAVSVSIQPVWCNRFNESDLHTFLIERKKGNVVAGYLPGQLYDRTWLEASVTKILPLLGKKLLGPIAAHLRAIAAINMVLIPCGLLGLLPIHAAHYLISNREVCLLDEFNIGYTPSARVLMAARATLATRVDCPPVLAGMGNPLPTPAPLQFAHAELEAVAALFPENARHPFYEEDASVGHLLAALPGATHIHLACHAMFDAGEPLNSHLQLAINTQLTLRRLLDEGLFRDTRLVVLSACQTAIADFRGLPDEAIGLPAGCLQAGTSCVVGTLWSVDDLSTTLLMLKFYQLHLYGDPGTAEGPMAPMQAIRQAQQWLRTVTAGELFTSFERHRAQYESQRQTGEQSIPLTLASAVVIRFALEDPNMRPFNSPYHWAPFILVGV